MLNASAAAAAATTSPTAPRGRSLEMGGGEGGGLLDACVLVQAAPFPSSLGARSHGISQKTPGVLIYEHNGAWSWSLGLGAWGLELGAFLVRSLGPQALFHQRAGLKVK